MYGRKLLSRGRESFYSFFFEFALVHFLAPVKYLYSNILGCISSTFWTATVIILLEIQTKKTEVVLGRQNGVEANFGILRDRCLKADFNTNIAFPVFFSSFETSFSDFKKL